MALIGVKKEDSRQFFQNVEEMSNASNEGQESTFVLLSNQNQVLSHAQIGKQQQIEGGFERLARKNATIAKFSNCCNRVFKIVQKRNQLEQSSEELDIIEDETPKKIKKSKKMFKIEKLKHKDQPSYTIANTDSLKLKEQIQKIDQQQFQNTQQKINKLKSKSSFASNGSINGSALSTKQYFTQLCKKNSIFGEKLEK